MGRWGGYVLCCQFKLARSKGYDVLLRAMSTSPSGRSPSPPSRVLGVSLFSQADNASGRGHRECLTSACAMVAAFHGRCRSDDEFARVRARFGDTIDPDAQLAALRSLGLDARFSVKADRPLVLAELAAGRPVAVGWLHQGRVTAPRGFGHWSVLGGWSPSAVWMLDPNGEADLVRGGYVSRGRGWAGWYSWRNWGPRWDHRPPPLPGQNSRPSGWAIFVNSGG
jgi:hypothetical protein